MHKVLSLNIYQEFHWSRLNYIFHRTSNEVVPWWKLYEALNDYERKYNRNPQRKLNNSKDFWIIYKTVAKTRSNFQVENTEKELGKEVRENFICRIGTKGNSYLMKLTFRADVNLFYIQKRLQAPRPVTVTRHILFTWCQLSLHTRSHLFSCCNEWKAQIFRFLSLRSANITAYNASRLFSKRSIK